MASPSLTLVATMLLTAGVFAATTASFAKEEADWRAAREARLKAPNGWLSVAGLFWLHEGSVKLGSDPQSDIALSAGAPRQVGTLHLQAGIVNFDPAAGASVTVGGKPAAKMILKPDTEEHPDVIQAGNLSLTVIKRGDRLGVRVRDPEAVTRRDFTGCNWFPASPKWRINAKWVAYPETKKIRITNILGMTDEEPSPGYAEFTINGKTLRLEPVEEDGSLSFMFKDDTSGSTTYPPGRFLDADMPKNGVVVLDFNQAYNPPCAFTAFATCPLPPKQNMLTVAVEAGESDTAATRTRVHTNPALILASRSPRRAELLTAAGIPFCVRAADIDETPLPGEMPRAYVLRMAEEKARAVAADEGEVILTADTTVVLGDEILGKPVDDADATRMLTALSGKRHEVLTGICLMRGHQLALDLASTSVSFSTMTAAEVADYVASGEPADKAGAYAIQGIASRWIDRIDGSYSNVVGLPVALVYNHLQRLGFNL